MALTSEQLNSILPILMGLSMFGLLILFWLRDFLISWLKVRASGGSKVLVRIRNDLHNYYRVGSLDKDFLYFKARKRPDIKDPKKMLPICPQGSNKPMFRDCVYRDWGVNVIEVDDVKECFLKYKEGSYESLPTGNSEAYDLAVQKALSQPPKNALTKISPQMMQYITIGGFIILGLALAYVISTQKNEMAGLIATYDNTELIKGMLVNMTKSTLVGG